MVKTAPALPGGAGARLPRAGSRGTFAVTATSVAVGLLLAVAVVAAPVLPASTRLLTSAVLLSFALGWALLALLSLPTGSPQRWALVPAAFLVVAAVVTMLAPPLVRTVFRWTWPPLLLVIAVWMLVRVRRAVPSAAARWLLYPLVVVLGLAALGGALVTVHSSIDRQAQVPPARLVDVGGHRLLLSCTGSGSPTVVLEPGLGASSADLRWIAPAVARDTTVCVYDRAGRGGSDDADGPQNGAHVAADLHALLGRAQVPGPYVLAGHSFGGLYALSFAAQFPDDVAGLVLLDSTAPARRADPAPTASSDAVDRVSVLMPALGRLGPGRALGSSVEEFFAGGRSVQDAVALTDLRGRPLLVLTADTGQQPTWFAQQDQLLSLSSNHLHRIAQGATHQSLVDDEEHAAAASQAVSDVVAAVRRSRPLGPA